MSFFDNFKNKNLIIAHRGFRKTYVENSFEALSKSTNQSDFLEFDVQFTKDYIPIIHHDETLSRMSNIEEFDQFKNRKPWFIKDFYYDEIKDIDIRGTKLLKLEDFLSFAQKNNIYFNLEIKDINKDLNDKKAINIILDLLNKYQCKKLVLISSFNHEYLKIILNIEKNIALAALFEDILPKNIIKYLKKLNVVSININKELINLELIDKLKEEGIKILIYTINDKKTIDELFELGIDGVFTDSSY